MVTLPIPSHHFYIFTNYNSDKEVIFNNKLRSARNQVVCSFGLLKARWAILTRKMDLKLEALPTVICVFILHNYCEKNKLYLDEEVLKSEIENLKKNKEKYKNILHSIFLFDCGEATITRKTITQ